MEELKFYHVRVGKHTRAGNLNVFQSFVAKSDKNQNDVYLFYSNKYRGFDISVEEIKEIVTDEVIVNKSNNLDYLGRTPEQVEISKLKEKISVLENIKPLESRSFKGTICWHKISNEITKDINDLEAIKKTYQEKKEIISKKIISKVSENYNILPITSVSLGEWSESTSQIPYEVKLDGKILFTNNQI